MRHEHWRRLEEIFHEALERLDDDVQTLYAACGGDEELLREVESLLAQEASAEAFLTQPVSNMSAVATDSGSFSEYRGQPELLKEALADRYRIERESWTRRYGHRLPGRRCGSTVARWR